MFFTLIITKLYLLLPSKTIIISGIKKTKSLTKKKQISKKTKSMKTHYIIIFTILLISSKLHSQSYIDYYNSGYKKALIENYDDATTDFSKSLEINPNYTKARLARAISYQQIMNKEKDKNAKAIYYVLCIKDFDYLISQIEDKQYFTLRGNMHYGWYLYSKNQKSKNSACSDWRFASELGDTKAGEFLRDYCK